MTKSPSVEPMAPMDELFFRSERDPIRRPTTYAIYVLDRTPKWSDLLQTFERASRSFLRFRQHVIEPTGGLGPACWVVDPAFDLNFHLRRGAVPPSEDESPEARMRALLDVVEPELMTPLDLSRPLWQVTLYEGLGDGRAALLFKASHAIADGLGGVQISTLLFDSERDAGRRRMPAKPEVPDVTADSLALEHVRSLPSTSMKRLMGIAGAAGRLGRQLLTDADEVSDYVASLRRVLSRTADPSPLLEHRGASRRLLTLDVALADLKSAARGGGGSINDAYLAMLALAMKRYHDRKGESVDAIPIAIPISTRKADDDEGGNHFAGGMLALPLNEADPRSCMKAIHEEVARVREEVALGVFDQITPMLLGLPQAVTERTAASIPTPDLQASNVPAQRVPIYLCGAEVEKQIGIGPLPGIAVMATMLSYCGNCAISFNVDPAALTDLPLFEECLQHALEEVLSLGKSLQPS